MATKDNVPRGIFKRETKGQSDLPVSVQVERGRIQFFASVLGLIDPIHFDVNKARSVGYPDLVAPPSFVTVLHAAAGEERKRRGQKDITTLVGCDARYLLHGEESYIYHGLVYAGDEVILSTQIVDFYDKKGGAMEFAVLEFHLAHAKRGLLISGRRTLLHRFG